MRRFLSILAVLIVSLSVLSAYDPYAAAAGYPVRIHHPEPRYHHSMQTGLSSSVLASAFGIPRSDADDIIRLLEIADDIESRRGRLSDRAYDVLSVLSGIYDGRRPRGEEDRALRSLSSTLDRILGGYGSWQDLERSVEKGFPLIIRSLSDPYR